MNKSRDRAAKKPMEPKLAAFFASLAPPISGFVFLKSKRREPLVRFYGAQSLVFGLAVLAGYGLLLGFAAVLKERPEVAAPITAGFGTLFVMTWLILWVVQMIAALGGREWEIPVVGPLARRLLTRFDRGEAAHNDGV